MTDYSRLESTLIELLGLIRRPVAVSFLDEPPTSIARFEGVVPSGCTFWRLASDGRVFYTLPGDHYNCPIGSYTHNIPIPDSRQGELTETLGLMTQIGYLRMEEVPGIPRLPATPAAVVYAPLGEAPLPPNAVIVAGWPASLTMLLESALRAGVQSELPVLARPTCMAIPAALASGLVTAAGCIGNRIYTDMGDDELYTVVPGSDLERILAELPTIASANAKLREYHQGRRSQLSVL
jgi:uncharacterized protein (DUF169 family)